MRRTLIAVLLALALVAVAVSSAFAQTPSAGVTVTASPKFISISNSPSTWTLNGITGSGAIDPDTTYYANPLGDTTAPSSTVVDGECRFTVTNSSTVTIKLTVTCGAFTGGDANMTNSEDGSNGATTYGAYCWYSGMTYASKVVVKSSGSLPMKQNIPKTETSILWGAEIETRTNAFTGGTSSTATMTITAAAQ